MRSTGKAKLSGLATEASGPPQPEHPTGVRMQSELVIKEDVILPLTDDPSGPSLGEMLDRQLADLAVHGGEPRSFSYEFDGKTWEQLRPYYQSKHEEFKARSERGY